MENLPAAPAQAEVEETIAPSRDYQAVITMSEVGQLIKELQNGPDLVSFDIETGYSSPKPAVKRALDTYHPDFFVVGFSITNHESWARYIPLRHDNVQMFDQREVWEAFRPIFENKHILAHNMMFEARALQQLAAQGDADAPIIMPKMHDSMIASHCSGAHQYHGLKKLTKEVLGVDQTEFGSLFTQENGITGKAPKNSQRFNQLLITPAIVEYGCDDSALCLELYKKILPTLTPEQRRIYRLELQILKLLVEIAPFGVGVDWQGIRDAHAQYDSFKGNFDLYVREGFAKMSVDPEVKEFAHTANFGSPQQMRSLLYDKLGMTTTRKTGTGALSTDAQALETLSRKHGAIRTLLDMREVDNLGRRLGKWLDEYYGARDLRVHPNFSQTQVVSGRFSANDPAIQQLPKTWFWGVDQEVGEDGKTIPTGENGQQHWTGNFRKFVVADTGKYLISFDYSQVELRVLAGVTQEPALLHAFANNIDPHVATASMMLGIPVDKVTKEDRAKGKTLNFGILYGMGPKSMAERLAISIEEARTLEDQYKSQFSRIGNWDSASRIRGMTDHKVHTWLGRTIPLWLTYEEDPYRASGGERLAVNAQIQGGAADYVKLAMLRSWGMLKKAGMWGKDKVMLTMNQHDALTFECSNEFDPNEVRKILQAAVVFKASAMFPDLPVPAFPEFEVDWELGKTWGGSSEWALDKKAVWNEEAQQWTVEGAAPEPDITMDDPEAHIVDLEVVHEKPLMPSLTLVPTTEPAQLAPKAVNVPEPVEDTRTVVITLPMPTREALGALVDLLKAHPGAHPVHLSLAGEATPLNLSTSLTDQEQGKFTLALRGKVEVTMIDSDDAKINLHAV